MNKVVYYIECGPAARLINAIVMFCATLRDDFVFARESLPVCFVLLCIPACFGE